MEMEIGQHYVRSNRTGKRTVKVHEIVTIVGEVEKDTEEYKNGFRYYSSFGEFFGESGESYRDSKMGGRDTKGNSVDRNLEFLADETDLKEGVQKRYRLTMEDVTRRFPQMFLSSTDPDFVLKAGGIYVNRMGFLVLIDRTHSLPGGDRIRYHDHQFGYNYKGKRKGGVLSMRDLVFQRT